MTDTPTAIARFLQQENDFLVVSHEGPDGDAIGSTLAMGFLLQALGKRFELYNATGLPEHFKWLRSPAPVRSSLESIADLDARRVIVLDCGDPMRMGEALHKAVNKSNIVNIDHHAGNPSFGALNWVDTSMAAVGEMVALLAQHFDVPLSDGLGENVYLAIVSDTGSFSYGNTKPETLELAAGILRGGLDVGAFNAHYQNQWEFKRIQFWSEVLGSSGLHLDGRVGLVRIPLEIMREHGVGPEDCDGLVEFMRRVKTVRVAVSLREEDAGMVKFSLRSHGKDNVQQVARVFDGGGHPNAAGGVIKAPLQGAQDRLLEAIARCIDLDAANFPAEDGNA